jgi:hypothetical protein
VVSCHSFCPKHKKAHHRRHCPILSVSGAGVWGWGLKLSLRLRLRLRAIVQLTNRYPVLGVVSVRPVGATSGVESQVSGHEYE